MGGSVGGAIQSAASSPLGKLAGLGNSPFLSAINALGSGQTPGMQTQAPSPVEQLPLLDTQTTGSSRSQPVATAPQVVASGRTGGSGQQATSQQPGDRSALWRKGISTIESSGNPRAIGPRHERLGRALGKYQVMEANIPQWSREALGRSITPEEFLQNEDLQDKIFDHKFGGYVKQFGETGAAEAWFAGPGGVGKSGRKDVLGTSVGEYGKKFLKAMGEPVSISGGARAQAGAGAGPGTGVPNYAEQLKSRMFGGGMADVTAGPMDQMVAGLREEAGQSQVGGGRGMSVQAGDAVAQDAGPAYDDAAQSGLLQQSNEQIRNLQAETPRSQQRKQALRARTRFEA